MNNNLNQYGRCKMHFFFSFLASETPTFDMFPTEHSLVEGSDLTFQYYVNSSPRPSISWYKVYDGDKEERLVHCGMDGCTKDVSVPGLDINRSYFILHNLSYSWHDMVLKCVAENFGRISNRTLRVSVKGKILANILEGWNIDSKTKFK